jgi:hypothetical protein
VHAGRNAVVALAVALALALTCAPRRAAAQAEPAPPGYVPPGGQPVEPPPSPYKWHLAADARVVVPLSAPPPALPQVGWGAGIQLTRALADLGRLRFGLGADFAYLRVEHTHQKPLGLDDKQLLANTTFAGLLVLDGIFDRLHPWLAAGGGFSVAQYHDAANGDVMTTTDVLAVVGLIQVGLGLDIALYKTVELGLGGQFDFTLSDRQAGNPPTRVFTPGFFSGRVGVGFRF